MQDKPQDGRKDRADGDEARSRDAQAALDQVRHQAGGALSGDDLRKRWKLDKLESPDDPPLDWRLTPKNVILQLLAVALFIGVVWFIVALVTDSLHTLFG